MVNFQSSPAPGNISFELIKYGPSMMLGRIVTDIFNLMTIQERAKIFQIQMTGIYCISVQCTRREIRKNAGIIEEQALLVRWEVLYEPRHICIKQIQFLYCTLLYILLQKLIFPKSVILEVYPTTLFLGQRGSINF